MGRGHAPAWPCASGPPSCPPPTPERPQGAGGTAERQAGELDVGERERRNAERRAGRRRRPLPHGHRPVGGHERVVDRVALRPVPRMPATSQVSTSSTAERGTRHDIMANSPARVVTRSPWSNTTARASNHDAVQATAGEAPPAAHHVAALHHVGSGRTHREPGRHHRRRPWRTPPAAVATVEPGTEVVRRGVGLHEQPAGAHVGGPRTPPRPHPSRRSQSLAADVDRVRTPGTGRRRRARDGRPASGARHGGSPRSRPR